MIYRTVIKYFSKKCEVVVQKQKKPSEITFYKKQIHDSLSSAITRVDEKYEKIRLENKKLEENYLTKFEKYKMDPFLDDIASDEVNYFDKQLYSNKELVRFYELASKNNFSVLEPMLSWLDSLINIFK